MAVGTQFVSSLLAVTLASIFLGKDVYASNSCPQHVTKLPHSHTAVHNLICYLFVNNELFWSKARDACWDLGGEMLSIDNQETMSFIKKKLDSPELRWDREGVWLGAKRVYGRWSWTNGKFVNYTNWAPGQPSMLLGILSVEDCSQMRQDDGWKWHDIPCGALSFHYNYVCQFPAVSTTAMTTKTSSTTTSPSALSSTMASINRTYKELNSEEFKRLGEEFFRLLSSHGLSVSSNVLHASDNHAALNRPGDVAGRVSSSTSNQTQDNGNSAILAIIIGVSSVLLLIMGIIFLVLYLHNRRKNQKANETLVHFSNNTYNRSPNGPALPANLVPPIPTSPVPVFASNDELYLDPQEDDQHKNHKYSVNVTEKGWNCAHHPVGASVSICSSPGTDSELGACGGSDPEQELKVPLMTSSEKTNCELVGKNCTPNGCLHSCCSQPQGDYIDMNSLVQEKQEKRLKEEDEKHTYSNVDHRDSGFENLYEVLP